MPDLDGLEVLHALRERGDDVPVCILSARDEVEDRVRGLEAGADDYVVKPFALEEVAARACTRCCAAGPAAPAPARGGRPRARSPPRRAPAPGRDLELTGASSSCCALFMRRPATILDARELHEEVWGYTFDPARTSPTSSWATCAASSRRRRAARPAHRARRGVRPAA
jgi:DNA-binding response OmpR family regulator